MRIYLKITALLLALFLIAVCFVACGGGDETTADETTDETTTKETSEETTVAVTTQVERPTDEEVCAMDMVETIFSLYGVSGANGDDAYINLLEYYNNDQSGYLWSNFCGVGMQYYVCKLYPEDTEQLEIFRQMINNFAYFRQRSPGSNAAANSVKYHSARGRIPSFGSGTCFFDDNIWVARNFLRAYEILGDEWYLEEAIRVNNWVLSGWDDTLGGIVWSEDGLKDTADAQNLERGLSANACAIIVNAKLASLAENEEDRSFYTEWAERFYTFCKKMQNTPQSYDYWNGIHTVIVDGVRKDGSVNKVHYSYNSGSMILANLALYDITEDEAKKAEYLNDATNTAKAAYKTFYATDSTVNKRYFSGDPWFAAILCEAYYELYDYDPTLSNTLMGHFGKHLAIAYANRDTATGILPYQATKSVTWNQNETYVIHQVGWAEQAVLVALHSLRDGK